MIKEPESPLPGPLRLPSPGELAAAWSAPGPEGCNLQVNQFLTFHLMRIAGIAKACVSREYLRPAGLTVPEWRLIATVAAFSPIQFADVTAMSTMDKGQVSRALQLARSKGYVDTEFGSAAQVGGLRARSTSRVIVTITPAGKAIYEQVMTVAQRYQMRLLGLMSPDERRVVADVLRRVDRHLSSGAA